MNDKEKYNAALETVQDILSSGADAIRIKTLKLRLQSVFPELVESEGERIRKAIISCCLDHGSKYKYLGVKMEEMCAWLEKQGEQKPFDKVEPKFKVGDWITSNNDGEVWQIGSIYYVTGRCCYLYNKNRDSICVTKEELNNDYHLWTIQDAKDGDVLVTTTPRNCPFIYRMTHYNNNLAYFYAGIDGNGNFCEGYLTRKLYHFGSVANVVPATEEQRNLLFQKMKEAGYEWDSEKKELKKIEVVSKEGEDEQSKNWILEYLHDGLRKTDEQFKDQFKTAIAWLEKQSEKPTIIDVDKMVREYSQTKDGDFGLPVNCMIKAYEKGINDALKLSCELST